MENTGGGSCIIGPNGKYLAGPVYEGEVVLTAEISLEDALPGKQIHNVLGNYTRWDVFSLLFNRKRLLPFNASASSGEINSIDFPCELREIRGKVAEVSEKLDRLTEKLRDHIAQKE